MLLFMFLLVAKFVKKKKKKIFTLEYFFYLCEKRPKTKLNFF